MPLLPPRHGQLAMCPYKIAIEARKVRQLSNNLTAHYRSPKYMIQNESREFYGKVIVAAAASAAFATSYIITNSNVVSADEINLLKYLYFVCEYENNLKRLFCFKML